MEFLWHLYELTIQSEILCMTAQLNQWTNLVRNVHTFVYT